MSTEQPTYAVELQGAAKRFATRAGDVTALAPTDLAIANGEFLAVMGPSGSGKSTLLSLAGALERPSAGRVRIQGQDLAALDRTAQAALRRQTLGFVFQEYNLLPGLTALENVALPLELDGQPLSKARDAAHRALAALGMDGLGDRFPEDLSGGERQRVAISRAFVGPRRLLLADEPTGALDSVTAELVLRQIRRQCDAGCTALLATHHAAHAAWADRILELRDGVLTDPGPEPASAAPLLRSPFQ